MRHLIFAIAALIAVICMAFTTGAFAAPYGVLTVSDNSVTVYDASTVQRTGDMIKVWNYTVYRVPPAPNSNVDVAAAYDEMDCKNLRTRTLILRAIDANNEPVGETRGVTEWTYYSSTQVGGYKIKTICTMGTDLLGDRLTINEVLNSMRETLRK